MIPDPGQSNWLATTALVVLIAAVAVGVIYAIAVNQASHVNVLSGLTYP